MKAKDDFLSEKEKKHFKTYYEDEETKRRFPGFILICLITTIGVMLALGFSFSAIKLMNSDETINTLISNITGDNKDRYIITYVENTGDFLDDSNKKNGGLYISSAEFYNSTNGGKGNVIYYGGLMLTTKTTFENKDSTVTYKIIIKNDSSTSKVFNGLFYNDNLGITYTITGINKGDIVGPSKSVVAYLTISYNSDNPSSEFPKEIESTSEFNFGKEDGNLHIVDANVYKTTNDGKGEVLYYGGMLLETKTTFENKNSTVTYKVTVKNDSSEVQSFNGITYNNNSNVKYTYSGINIGDKFNPGESKTFYIIIENTGNNNYPEEVISTVEMEFTEFGVTQEYGIYLINQFPTKDEVGKKFQGRNYVFTFSLLLGKKAAGSYYEISLVPFDNNTLPEKYVKVYLEKDKQGVDMSYRTNGRVKVYTEYEKSEYQEVDGRVIYKGYITEDEVSRGKIDFVMRMWVTEDLEIDESVASIYFNKRFSATVNTYALYPQK